MGVWIEIHKPAKVEVILYVTPFMGVWIEIKILRKIGKMLKCHSLYGSVD